MYIILDKNKQKEIILSSITKAGSYRKLSKNLDIPRSSLVAYKHGRPILKERFETIINFLKINKTKISFKTLEKNWKEIKGGKNCVISKKNKGTFERDLKKAQKKGIEKIKEWHKKMKEENPREYHKMQYAKFKKVMGYKHFTKRGEKVRNWFEKDAANVLYELKIDYKYEPLVNIGKKYFYPDFLINDKIIIECTAWEDEYKAYKLKEKMAYLKQKYKVYVLIPKHLYRYYKILDKDLIVGLDKLVPVAQTFLS